MLFLVRTALRGLRNFSSFTHPHPANHSEIKRDGELRVDILEKSLALPSPKHPSLLDKA